MSPEYCPTANKILRSMNEHLTQNILLLSERGNLIRFRFFFGKQLVKVADGRVSLGYRKKQRSCCNGKDTNFIWRESELTSDEFLVARKFA
jgi:hypothetical protein